MKSYINPKQDIIELPGVGAFLPGVKAAITFEQKQFYSPPDSKAKNINAQSKDYNYIPWGASDNLPNLVNDAIAKNVAAGRGMEFNVVSTFGKGIKPVLKNDDGTTTELKADHPVTLFFENNDLNTWFLEQCTDMHFFFNVFNEVILADDGSSILQINHLEAMFSRLTELNAKGVIENHLYSAKFGTSEKPKTEEIDVTPMLPSKFTYDTLMNWTGKGEGEGGNKKNIARYAMQSSFPMPGRIYYPKPYWYSILDSGWLEFANAVPQFKKALMENQITIKYQIIISEDYFPLIFKSEGITDPKKQQARVKLEYDHFQEFLADTKNTAKSFFTYAKNYHGQKGLESKPLVEIKAVENHFKGGEFIEDSEEANNIISYALGVHPLITGASPGKNGSINGTEARELFNLKRALLFPYRWQILKPLYFIKRFNNWEPNIYFAVDDIELVTLDKNKSGTETKTTIQS